MKKTVVVAGVFTVVITALITSHALAQKSSTMMGKWSGVTIQAKLIGGNLYEPLYARIAAWEKATGAQVQILSKKNHFDLMKEYKADMAAGNVNWCLGSNHTSFSSQFDDLYTDLAPYFSKDILEGYTPTIIAASSLGKNLQMIPRAQFDVSATYYQKSLYNSKKNQSGFKAKYGYELKPPKTLQQYKDQAIFFSAPPNLYGTQYAGKDEAIVGRFFEVLVAEGGQMFTADNSRSSFNSAAGERALQFFVDLYKANAVPKGTINYSWDELGQGFASGTVALDHDWPGWASFFNDPKASKVAGNVGVSASVVGPSGKRLGWSGTHGFSITKKCANKEATASLIWYLTNDDAQRLEAKSGSLPTRPRVWSAIKAAATASKDLYRYESLKAFEETSAGAYPVPQTPLWSEAVNKIFPELQAAILGQKTAKQALTDAATGADTVLARK
jgi:multiple sugar transport system substrate-binding protein